MKLVDRAFWLLDDLLDWLDAKLAPYLYRGVHRGVYDWEIGSTAPWWDMQLPKNWRLRFVDGVPHYQWEGPVYLPDHTDETATLLITPGEGLIEFPTIMD